MKKAVSQPDLVSRRNRADNDFNEQIFFISVSLSFPLEANCLATDVGY